MTLRLTECGYRVWQYRTRIKIWKKDKNVKTEEMRAIVRKRQTRKLVECDKGNLDFRVRGSRVPPQKIKRWMKRHEVDDSALYVPSSAACKLTRATVNLG